MSLPFPGNDVSSLLLQRSGEAMPLQKTALNSEEELREVAKQFESIFVKMMLKSMRAASPDSGMWNGPGMGLYRDMFDDEMSKSISEGGSFGLADVMVQQISKRQGNMKTSDESNLPGRTGDHAGNFESPREFIAHVMPVVERAAALSGVPAEGVLAQSALETAWGRRVPAHPDGRSSNNLFGIKAGGNWQGDRVAVETTEFIDGVAEKRREWFRAYDSIEDSVTDYFGLLNGASRYAEATGRDGHAQPTGVRDFATRLQQAGYATDPEYAAKIERIANSSILNDAMASLKKAARLSIGP